MNRHFKSCQGFQHILALPHQFSDLFADLPDPGTATDGSRRHNDETYPDAGDFYFEMLKTNSKILSSSNDWLTLSFLEPLLAKRHNAKLNQGEMAMRSLHLF